MVDLVTVGEARRDQHLMPNGIPAGKIRSAKIAVALSAFHDRHGNGRDTLDRQVFVGSESIGLREERHSP
jgi:hypothetical protein